MACEEYVAGCFANETAPFAVHPADEQRAFEYLKCCRAHKMSWMDVKNQIEAYLKKKGVTSPEFIGEQLEMARQKFQPWLD